MVIELLKFLIVHLASGNIQNKDKIIKSSVCFQMEYINKNWADHKASFDGPCDMDDVDGSHNSVNFPVLEAKHETDYVSKKLPVTMPSLPVTLQPQSHVASRTDVNTATSEQGNYYHCKSFRNYADYYCNAGRSGNRPFSHCKTLVIVLSIEYGIISPVFDIFNHMLQ